MQEPCARTAALLPVTRHGLQASVLLTSAVHCTQDPVLPCSWGFWQEGWRTAASQCTALRSWPTALATRRCCTGRPPSTGRR